MSLQFFRKNFWTVLDQIFFSGTNLVINILLARWLPSEEYGAFVFIFSLFLLIAGFHSAILTEPLMIFGAGKYKKKFKVYLGILFYSHWLFYIIMFLLIWGIYIILYLLGIFVSKETIYTLSISTGFLLFFWLARKACYATFKVLLATFNSFLYLILNLIILYILYFYKKLSLVSSFLSLGLSSLIVSLVIFWFLKPKLLKFPTKFVKLVITRHIKFGIWNIGSFILYWLSTQSIWLLVPIFLGFTANAIFSAAWNLYRPLSLLIQAIPQMLLPYFSNLLYNYKNLKTFKTKVNFLAFLLGSLAFVYTITITITSDFLLSIIYNGKYQIPLIILTLIGINIVESIVTSVFSAALKVKNEVNKVFKIWKITAAITIVGAIPSMYLGGLIGVLMLLNLVYFLSAIMAYKIIKDE